jgi:hypothetical protein
MKPADRKLALKAYRLAVKKLGNREIAVKLKLESTDTARDLAQIGYQIAAAEALRLTDNELLVMKTLARIEARRVEGGWGSPKTKEVDWAAGKRSGWTAYVVDKRLRALRHSEVSGGRERIGYVYHSPNGHIWLTPSGWAFVWATGLVLKNWKVPA